jgi:DNA repair exonuclease SbcCD ATPase subunit
MIAFDLLVAEDFGCFKSVEVQLRDRGLMLVLGENLDTTAADSNGSGKSTLFKALSWVLFGQTVDGVKGTDIIRRGAKSAKVQLELTVDKTRYVVTRTKGRSKAEKLSIKYAKSGKSLGARTLKDAQALLEETLGLDWMSFKNTVLYGQGDVLHFADPRTTDTQRKAVLSKILRLERLDAARKIAREKKTNSANVVARLSGEIAILEGQLDTLGVDDLKSRAKSWADARDDRVDRITEQIKEVKDDITLAMKAEKKIKRLNKRADDVSGILDEYEEQYAKLRELKDEDTDMSGPIANAVALQGEIAREIGRIESAVEALEAGECPTCGAPSSSLHVKRKISKLRTDVGREEKRLKRTRTDEAKLRKQRLDLASEIASIEEELQDWDEWREQANTIRDKLVELRAQVERLPKLERRRESLYSERGEADHELNPFDTQIKEKQAQATVVRESLDEKRDEKKKTEREGKLAAFWVDGFGPSGLSSYLMDSVVPVVAEKANRYLEVLSDGDLRVKLDTLTTLKGGSVRDKLSVIPTIEGIEGVPPSGGQLKKITLACDLALMDLLANREGASVDLLLLDEVLDGLDSAGRARVMNLLKLLRTQRSTIIVISHDPEIVEQFSRSLTVVKSGGVAKLKAA